MKKTLLGMLVLGLLLAADDKKPDDPKDKLQGVWNVVSVEAGGQKLPDKDIKGTTLTFDGDKVTHEEKGKKETSTFKIDASKTPAQLDVTPTEGPEKDKTMKMIFELKDDTLKIAGKMKPDERPTGFGDKDVMIITLSRAKKATDK